VLPSHLLVLVARRRRDSAGKAMGGGIPMADGAKGGDSCPVAEDVRPIYNVYNQRIDKSAAAPSTVTDEKPLFPGMRRLVIPTATLDPSNNMPVEPNQRPWHTQTKPLSTERQASTIPKGGTSGTWTYPSPQMFFNALKRKGKGEDVEEDDMNAVISTHNGMNEATWQHVALWEQLHRAECGEPKLMRFLGRPHDLSPSARIKSWFGKPLPFDRHDWYIDRCGREVRYVIDFYFDEEKAGTIDQFEIIARPALDSVESALDRVKMSIYERFAEWGLPCPISGHEPTIARQPEGSS